MLSSYVISCFSDINECNAIENVCGNGTCQNGFGSYRCVCVDGFRFDDTQGTCLGKRHFLINSYVSLHKLCGYELCCREHFKGNLQESNKFRQDSDVALCNMVSPAISLSGGQTCLQWTFCVMFCFSQESNRYKE